MYVYEIITCIDFFKGMKTLERYLIEVNAEMKDATEDIKGVVSKELENVLSLYGKTLFEILTKTVWEGDFQDPFIFFLPCEYEVRVGFVIKQSNNGTTFAASELELPWLANCLK